MNLQLLKKIFFVSFSICTMSIFAQSSPFPNIVIKSITNPDNSVDFKYTKEGLVSYIVKVKFTKLLNSEISEDQIVTLNSDSGFLFKLKPLDKNKKIDYLYRFTYTRGFLNPVIDSSEIYLLPFEKEKKIRVYEIHRTDLDSKSWKSYLVYSKTQDSVFAMRKGLVVEIKTWYRTIKDEKTSQAVKIKKKEIIVEHPDGTFASYINMDEKSIFVKVGDLVLPHNTLGLMGKYEEEFNGLKYNSGFRVYYFIKNNEQLIGTEIVIDANFLTKKGIQKLENKKEYLVDVN